MTGTTRPRLKRGMERAMPLDQWVCVPCGVGPLGAMGHAICPKCNLAMTPVEVKNRMTAVVTARSELARLMEAYGVPLSVANACDKVIAAEVAARLLTTEGVEDAFVGIEDTLEELGNHIERVRKDYVRKLYPERACKNCDYVADEGEIFGYCPGSVEAYSEGLIEKMHTGGHGGS